MVPAARAPSPLPAGHHRITGVVKDPLERPIDGATVRIALGTAADTDPQGRFSVTTAAPAGANIKFMVSKPGYGYMETFISGANVVVTFPPGYTIDNPFPDL